jgi:transcriptional regulator with XRE-family HTH domain
MSNIGERIIQLRKAKKWSQEDLAKHINASRIMIGNYERGDNTPSMEVIIKIARAFEVSIDYLLGEGMNASFDKETLKRLEDMEKLPEEERKRIFDYMDLIIRDYKAGQAYSSK